jgi:hypothetical protein
MTETRHTPSARASVRKAAAAALEALPALLLAAALLTPAVAAFGGRTAAPASGLQPAAAPMLADEIAEQGNRALVQIRAESRASLRQSLTLPALP